MRFYDNLGFIINSKKPSSVPTQRIRILDFVIDSVKMIPRKEAKTKNFSFKFTQNE